MTTETQPNMRKLTETERSTILTQYIITTATNKGQRVETRTPTTAVLVAGKPVNHILHLLLSLLSLVLLGFWFLVWIGLAVFAGEKRTAVSVDEYGIISAT